MLRVAKSRACNVSLAQLQNLSCLNSSFWHGSARTFGVASTLNSAPKDLTKKSTSDQTSGESATSHDTSQRMVPARWIDKKTLVWDGRYATMAEVPEMLPHQTVVHCRNRFRIRGMMYMMAMTVVAAGVMVYTGKRASKSGDSIEKRNLEKHRQLRAQKDGDGQPNAAAAAK